jgi:hypothetical protein
MPTVYARWSRSRRVFNRGVRTLMSSQGLSAQRKCRESRFLVGRTPWSAADALVGLCMMAQISEISAKP